MKKKPGSKSLHQKLVEEGIVTVPVAAKVETPVKPTAHIVSPIAPKVNVAPTPAERAFAKPVATGLQRAINANQAHQNGETTKTTFTGPALTGVARAIAANQALQKKSE